MKSERHTQGILLLAAGASRRFQGIKQLAPLNSTNADDPNHNIVEKSDRAEESGSVKMLQLAVNTMAKLQAHDRIVTLGANAEAILPEITFPEHVGVIQVEDWQEGIAASIRTGVARLQTCSHILIMLADQPDLKIADYNQLIELSARSPQNIVCARYNGKNAVPAVFPDFCFEFLLSLTGDKGAGRFLNSPELQDRVVSIPLQRGATDIDTPSELAGWQQTNKQ